MSKKNEKKKNARKCGKCGRTGHYAKTCKYKTKAPKVKSVSITTGTINAIVRQIVAEEVERMMNKMYDRMMEKFRMESGLVLSEMRKTWWRNPYPQPKLVTCPRCKGKGKIQEGHKFQPHPQQESPFSNK